MASEINAQTKLYGILGNPVGHSFSPSIHNAAFDHFGINARYLAYEVEKHSLPLAFEGVRSLNLGGANITIPFKEEAAGLVDEIPEDLDRCVGAINTVVNKDGMLYGYNTDMVGFLTGLHEELNFNPEGKNVLVLGSGGAARAVVFALGRAHANRIVVYNRTFDRAEALVSYAIDFFPETEIDAIDDITDVKNEKEKIDLVVNATSLGMKGDATLAMDLGILENEASVYDLVYAPAQTPLLKEAQRLGMPNANGLGMLAAQAALSFELWTGKKEGVREIMLEALKKCL